MWKSIKKIKHEFLWKPLKSRFQKTMMSNKFVIRECGDQNGNCLLTCLEMAFQSDNIKMEKKYIYKRLIENVKNLNSVEFTHLINAYSATEQGGYIRFWEAKDIKKPKELANVIKKEDMFFQGNDIGTLYLISWCFKVEFIVFNEMYKAMRIGDQPSIIYLYYDSKSEKYSIIGLKYYTEKEIITLALFHKNNLPPEIGFLTNTNVYLIQMTKDIFLKAVEDKEILDKDKMVKKVEDNIFFQLNNMEKKQIGEILTNWIEEIKKQ